MTDNSKSSNNNNNPAATMPKDIPQPPRAMAQALSNNSPTSGRRNSFFEWAFGGFSPTSPTLSGSSPGSLPNNSTTNNYEHHRSNSVAEEVAARNATAIPRRKPRAMSQTFISHDEALNLSRAGFLNRSASTSGGSPRNSISSPSSASAVANSTGPSSPPAATQQQPRMQRKRQNSHYENIGVVAAFSGGPSSF